MLVSVSPSHYVGYFDQSRTCPAVNGRRAMNHASNPFSDSEKSRHNADTLQRKSAIDHQNAEVADINQ